MKRVLMIGTAPGGRGGVAAVVSVYISNGLFDAYPIRYVASHCDGGPAVKLAKFCQALISVAWLLLSRQVSVMHVHSSYKGSFLRKSIFLAMARWVKVPTIFHLHSGEFDRFADEYASPWLRRWIIRTLTLSSCVVALSENWAAYVRKLAPGAKTLVIANPVPLPAHIDRSQEVSGRLLFLGRADKQKGIYDLLEALAKVKVQVPGAHLALGGDGDLGAVRDFAKKLGVDGSLEVLGWLTGESKEEQYELAQVFVLPSYREGLPMSMLECMARAKAVVVTPVGGIPEAVQDGSQGLLVPPANVEALAEALVRLLTQPELRYRLGDAARTRVDECFSAEHVFGVIGQLYERLDVKPKDGIDTRLSS